MKAISLSISATACSSTLAFPVAHEDDAPRAVYTALSIVDDMATLNTRLSADYGVELTVRIGIHTGPVVVGEMGGGGRHKRTWPWAETPNICGAARRAGRSPTRSLVTPNADSPARTTVSSSWRSWVGVS